MKTDKSSKLAATDKETYLAMGQKHTSKDREIGKEEIKEREKILNASNLHLSLPHLTKIPTLGDL